VEHEHCDVGMTACKLAWEWFSGQRGQLQKAFLAFKEFASQRILPEQTLALLKAAAERGIPSRKLDRLPLPDGEFDGLIPQTRRLDNGLVALGHGSQAVLLEGLQCIGPARRCEAVQEPVAVQGEAPRIQELLDELFPTGQSGKIPLLTVTGTNGKTTTSRMVAHVLSMAGKKPGLACSDGLYARGKLLELGELAALGGHLKILARPDIDCAVLESHHRGIFQLGMPYQSSDVAICLNVTGDHLATDFIETMAELAEVKGSLLERAATAVVLFADDEWCLGMAPRMTAQHLCLVSLRHSHEEIQRLVGGQADSCVLNPDRQIVFTHSSGESQVFAHVDDIPITIDGTAEHNLSNAMHAMAASSYLGVDPRVIGSSMRHFESSYEHTPGRLNIHDNGLFRVVMDIAHNQDGFRKLASFVGRQQVSGRKLISFSLSGDRTRELVDKATRELAGSFDHYVVRAFRRKRLMSYEEVISGLRNGLLRAGVDVNRISTEESFDGEIERFLSMGRPGDLLVFISGTPDIHSSWKRITSFRPDPH
jgi:cyanophycin synthetase